MREVGEFIDLMEEELEDAKEYAERYISYKVSNDSDRAEQFKQMCKNDLEHSLVLYKIANEEIMRLKRCCSIPSVMSNVWDKKNTKFIEKAAWIKQMLTM